MAISFPLILLILPGKESSCQAHLNSLLCFQIHFLKYPFDNFLKNVFECILVLGFDFIILKLRVIFKYKKMSPNIYKDRKY